MKIDVDSREVDKLLENMTKVPDKAYRNAYKFLVKKTPIRTGNARRKTKKESDLVIASRYPYAGELDAGRSKQAPKGFTDPTIKELDKLITFEIGRID